MQQRFAPSPTGPLHLGHAYSALIAWHAAKSASGEFLLRIEDIDTTRSRLEYEALIFEDLGWLGLDWPSPVMRQSERMPEYQKSINILIENNLCYPCGCTRRDISAALSAPQEGNMQVLGPDGAIYPGTCRGRLIENAAPTDAIRLDMRKAIDFLGERFNKLNYHETGPQFKGTHFLDTVSLVKGCGDIVLARRDIRTSYHLAVVVDDAAQLISQVTRGEDMFAATAVHRLLQALLDLPVPEYHHHRLIRDTSGKRLAKRDDARAIKKFREDGHTPDSIRAMVGL